MQPIASFKDQIGPNSISIDHLGLDKGDISGDYISGGTITNFSSTGITDIASRNVIRVSNDAMVLTTALRVIDGNKQPIMEIDANGIRLNRQVYADSFIETKKSLSPIIELNFDGSGTGSGIVTKDQLNHQSILYKNNNWEISDSLRLLPNKSISIGNRLLLNEKELGVSVTKSNLKSVGVLEQLKIKGDFDVNETLYFNTSTNKLGVNTLDPNGVLGLMENGVEICVRGEDYLRAKIGTYTKHELHLVVNNQTALMIDVDGKIVLGVDNNTNAKLTVNHNVDTDFAAVFSNTGKGLSISSGPESKLVVMNKIDKTVNFIVDDNKVGINVLKPEATLDVNGDVKMMGRHMWSAPKPPTDGTNHKGDIVWNSDPGPTQPVGWICIKDGVPGIWAVFGRIESLE